MDVHEVIERVLARVKPGEGERKLVDSITRELIKIAEEEIEEFGLDVRPVLVGSIAKDTYLSGDHDVDLFLAFPIDVPLKEVREEGFRLARMIGERLEGYEIGYAEHPYVRARYRGFHVDIVPCYDVKDWREVRTAVDRSILHTRWVIENLGGRNDEVRLLKRFFKGLRAYGSEAYVRGFSGYLAEILVIHYGSFLDVLEKADLMLKQKIIDPARWLRREPEIAMKTVGREIKEDNPLIVLDPVDPRRNVAANLSWERFALFYFGAMRFLKSPSEEFFFPRTAVGDYRAELRRKGTHLVTLLFDPPGLVDDVLLPQIEKSARGIARALELEGFTVLGFDYGGDYIFIEVGELSRPAVRVKRGPHFFTEMGRRFYEKNERTWVEGKDLIAEKPQEPYIVDVIEEILERGNVALGKNVREAIRRADILVDFVPRRLEESAYLFLSREQFRV
ncbi:CCA tRNA nucleotidyltransferase [Pyrococcus yayanosii]|uniref:CCA-adding enzyme n=1 Tax=Pyrococcus yayanosii (strain CH1 / JCM 16557) TaxID=529709 RepID=F8AGE1_PYRYC|nr:CCA tRNA nucleotidyltransferase [Pyrococcus yayanosii]AEH25137.1 tRNA CCA-pyrophosphorylase [Pyrococcus yayanosii CH1]